MVHYVTKIVVMVINVIRCLVKCDEDTVGLICGLLVQLYMYTTTHAVIVTCIVTAEMLTTYYYNE